MTLMYTFHCQIKQVVCTRIKRRQFGVNMLVGSRNHSSLMYDELIVTFFVMCGSSPHC